MSDPALCIPPNSEVSGWWYLQHENTEEHEYWNADHGGWWDNFVDDGMTPADAHRIGYRILGPVPSFAEVEALRAEIANLLALCDGDAYALRQMNTQLTAANAEIARLKSPDLVTVRREDLRELIGWSPPWTPTEQSRIEQRIAEMETAAE